MTPPPSNSGGNNNNSHDSDSHSHLQYSISAEEKSFHTLIYWILGTVTAICFGASAAWLSTVQEQLRELRIQQSQQQVKLASLDAAQNQMAIWFPKLEGKVDKLDDKLSSLVDRLTGKASYSDNSSRRSSIPSNHVSPSEG